MTTLSRLLKESWTLVEDRADKVAGYFYARLFTADPQVRDLFPVQMDVQRARLLSAILQAVQTVDNPEHFDAYLRALGRDHRKFYAKEEHYRAVGGCLVEALRTFAGAQWTPEYEQAWLDAYDAIATRMLAGAVADEGNPAVWHAEVLRHVRLGPDLATFTVKPMQRLRYRAGQYVTLECKHQSRLWRTYSPANAPRADGTIDFHVRSIGAGWVSSALVRRLGAGDMIRLGPPMGTMTLDRRSGRDIVCVAGGTGLAPIKAIVEELARVNRTRWVHLFWGVRRKRDLYDLAALERIAGRHRWLTVVPSLSEESAGWDGEVGNVCDVVARRGPWLKHDFFVCGSAPMVKSTLRAITGLGVPAGRVRYDAFSDL